MGIKYKGFEIVKTTRFGYSYYRVVGTRDLFSTIKAAKAAIDSWQVK